MTVPITTGSGAASVAAEAVAGLQYQQIEVLGAGGASTLGVNPDGSFKASIIGVPTFSIGGGSVVSIPAGSVITVLQSSSILSVQSGTQITSIVSTVPSSVLVGTSIFGQLPAGTAPLGSVATLQGTNPWVIVGSVYGSGSVASYPLGTIVTSLVSTIPSSVIVGSSIFGQLPSGTAPLGSVATLQGTNPWQTNHVGSGSVISVPSGSVISVAQGSVAAFTTITSIAVANGGMPIWSPLGSRLQGTADLRTVQGGSVAVIAAQGSGVFTYVDHVQVLNFGSSSVLVTIADVTTSILGYTIAPAGGGSNYDTFYKTAANNPITASLNGTASVLVSMQGFKSAT